MEDNFIRYPRPPPPPQASDHWQKPMVWVGLTPALVNSVFCEPSSGDGPA